MKKHKTTLIALIAAITTVLGAPGLGKQTKDIGLAWDASPSPTVTEYVVYFGGASAAYTNSLTIVPAFQLTAIVTNLTANTWYFFAVTARDALGHESDYSNEVSVRTDPPPPLPPQALKLGQ